MEQSNLYKNFTKEEISGKKTQYIMYKKMCGSLKKCERVSEKVIVTKTLQKHEKSCILGHSDRDKRSMIKRNDVGEMLRKRRIILMKKAVVPALLLGLILSISGCGFDPAIDATVTIAKVTPTPEPEKEPETKPEAAATPTPEPTPTPEVVTEQTPSGIKVEVKTGTYTTTAPVNLRADASADAQQVNGAAEGTQLNSTGVCENGWIRVEYDGQVCYVSGDYVTLVQ